MVRAMTSQPGNAKLAQIAREAGVSLSTASKVLNNRPGVSDATRKRIEALLEKNGYRRRRRTEQTTTTMVELLLDDLDTPWSEEILSGVLAGLNKPYVPIISARTSEDWNISDWLEEVLARKSAGVIIPLFEFPKEAEERLARSGIPTVLVDPTGEVPKNVPTVGSNDYIGVREATEYLIAQGHTRIAFIGGPTYLQTAASRLDGFRGAMRQAGIAVDPMLVTSGEFRYEDGSEHARGLLALPNPPTAIFAASDMQAAGVYAVAWERGLKIPDDLSVVGFDDLPTSRMLLPPLTTVHHAVREMAQFGATTLMQLLEGKGGSMPTHIELTTNLIVRQSVRKLP
ncbi:LacI family transcriptional regulator [Bifidobacterium scaligerum]|uniref:LacI family transcriptional regulator n=2 Tax=Bifidobacterium scaligerum TaxID=2052656 RepID=A0A2M9HQ56_9BIFI|nr:LacI family transcriptional regulator [Bifidobacterium scaligerum]